MGSSAGENRGVVHCLAISTGLFVLYALLRQQSGYGDGPGILLLNRDGGCWLSPNHFLYPPLLSLWTQAFARFGVDDFEAAGLLSSVSTAIGASLVYRACRVLEMDVQPSIAVSLLVGTTPAVVFFATAVELHAVFFLCACWCLVRLAWLVVRPSPRNALLLGLATGLAYAAHATAHLLIVALIALYGALRRPRTGMSIPAVALISLGAHVTGVCSSVAFVQAAFGAKASTIAAPLHLVQMVSGAAERIGALPLALLHEWVVAFLPISATWLCAALRPELRAMAMVTGACVVAYSILSFALLPGLREHGAYLLPLAWPAAWLTARSLPPAILGIVLLGGLGSAWAQVARADDPTRAASYAQGFHEARSGATASLLIGDGRDLEACAVALPEVERVSVAALAVVPCAALLPSVDLYLKNRLGDGRRVFVTQGAIELLSAASGHLPCATALLEHLSREYAMREVRCGGFRACRIEMRGATVGAK